MILKRKKLCDICHLHILAREPWQTWGRLVYHVSCWEAWRAWKRRAVKEPTR